MMRVSPLDWLDMLSERENIILKQSKERKGRQDHDEISVLIYTQIVNVVTRTTC